MCKSSPVLPLETGYCVSVEQKQQDPGKRTKVVNKAKLKKSWTLKQSRLVKEILKKEAYREKEIGKRMTVRDWCILDTTGDSMLWHIWVSWNHCSNNPCSFFHLSKVESMFASPFLLLFIFLFTVYLFLKLVAFVQTWGTQWV